MCVWNQSTFLRPPLGPVVLLPPWYYRNDLVSIEITILIAGLESSKPSSAILALSFMPAAALESNGASVDSVGMLC